MVQLAKEFVIKVGSHVANNVMVVARCTDFSLSLGKNTVDITSFDSDGFEEYLADNKNWSITFGSMVTRGTAPTSAHGSGVFINLFEEWVDEDTDHPVTVSIGKHEATAGEEAGTSYFEGEGILTDLSVDGSVGDKATYSGTIQGSGKIERKTT